MEKKNYDTKNESSGPKSGRIGRLDEQTLSYYRRVSDTLKGNFENDEDKEIFLKNVLSQLATEALKVSQNQSASSIVEELLHCAKPEQLIAIGKSFSLDWETAICDRFASYVIQTYVLKTAQFFTASEDLQDLFETLYQFLNSQLGVFMQHTYASHIVRVVIEVLGGVRVADGIIRSKISQAYDKGKKNRSDVSLPKPNHEHAQWLQDIAHKILNFGKLSDFATNSVSNPVLQTLLLVTCKRDALACASICRTLIDNIGLFKNKDKDGVPALVSNEISSHLVEQVFALASNEVFMELFDTHFKGTLIHYACHPVANFVVQNLIRNLKTAEQFETVFSELSDHLEDILADNHLGVIVTLAEGAGRHGTKQKSMIKALQKAFHCYEPDTRQAKFAPLLGSLTTYDIFYKLPDSDDEKEDSDDEVELQMPTLKTVNYHGSVILQKLLQFGNPKSVVTSLVDMKPVELETMACDPCGSHVLDAFIKSPTVGEKSREGLYNRLKGHYLELALNKNGSRTLDTMWNAAPMKQRMAIADELAKHESKLRGHRFGMFIWRNYALHHYLHRKQEWKEIQTGQMKKRKLFQEIIGTGKKEEPALKKSKPNKTKLEESHLEEEEDSNVRLQLSDDDITSEKTSANDGKAETHAEKPKKTKKEKSKKRHNSKKYGEQLIKDKSMKGLVKDMKEHSSEAKGKKKKKSKKKDEKC